MKTFEATFKVRILASDEADARQVAADLAEFVVDDFDQETVDSVLTEDVVETDE